jgi:short-subunit dehydrogenase
MSSQPQAALITGASAGIGRELAKLFAADRYSLALVARNGPRLAQFADELQREFSVTAKSFPLDLTAASAPQFLFDQLARENIAIDVLVNNA